MNRENSLKSTVGRRERKKAETAQRIAAASRKLLRSKGFEALTTQEVAIEAGIPPGTLFGYITSKTDLLIVALVHEAIEFVGTIAPRIPSEEKFLDRVQFVFEEMAVYHGRDLEVTRHFLRELGIARNPNLRGLASSLGDAVRKVVAALIDDEQSAGRITAALPAEKISRFLFAHYWQSLRLWISGTGTRQDFTTTLREALRWQIAGLKPARAKAKMLEKTVVANKARKAARKG